MKRADLLLFRFGYGEIHQTDPVRYSSQCPGFGVESAQFVARPPAGFRAMGMDVPSGMHRRARSNDGSSQRAAARAGTAFLVIEDMKRDEDLSRLEEVILARWWIPDWMADPAR